MARIGSRASASALTALMICSRSSLAPAASRSRATKTCRSAPLNCRHAPLSTAGGAASPAFHLFCRAFASRTSRVICLVGDLVAGLVGERAGLR